ncbi:quinoprotein dehydrogenase-associated SoxYZ-like carrier (plasmid) [Sphingobium sp. SCG-1]|uniref:quinoprotein dehydrogenase-associated SoxYZ-like carrier n=1 Tax=Sphingobium sp. SCG-1 TaxID=2072936 RepID=UPI000CD6BAC0|nr:quinoprotein dehydrogenase-associated SoxYZ-like carrier [Sphingobium sp. SCG-1]AUW60605.1 quinoprotein dehydrogenase-associated SoxYZ-like carrier [Sphingobium sp. SCG-1]
MGKNHSNPTKRLGVAAIALFICSSPAVAEVPADPLQSPVWKALGETFFGDSDVRFDPRVRVIMPQIAENQRSFPVAVDARTISGVKRILIFADLNPIPLAIDYVLADAAPYLATNIKLDQRTPVRGAVQLKDGSWLVSGAWVDAAGGGCSMPPLSRARGDWSQHLGEIRGGAWHTEGGDRVRLAMRHPMDTGFVANIPTYHLESLALTDADGKIFGSLAIEASVAEDPVITVIVAPSKSAKLLVTGRDTNGIDYDATLAIMDRPVGLASALK